MEIKSSAFKEGESIPSKYTCDDKDLSPDLEWSKVPDGTKTFALIADDPDAPSGTFVHWVMYNIPGNLRGLPEKIHPKETLDNGTIQGMNDFGKIGYGGPCPPSGTHRYYFKLYALDARLDARPGLTKKELLKAIDVHVLEVGELMGRYKRKP
jgi:Raf kinase inhibitor-like YbhB/YbcL family protein